MLITSFAASVVEEGVQLVWTISADEPVMGYKLYREPGAGGHGVFVPEERMLTPKTSRFIDTTIRPGEGYIYTLIAVKENGTEVRSRPVKVEALSGALVLYQNHPNPFDPATTISFVLPAATKVNLSIFDPAGKPVRTLENGLLTGGTKGYLWDGKDRHGNPVSSGVYFYRLSAGKDVFTKKMLLIK